MCRKLWGDDIINSLIWIFIRTGQEMFSEKIWNFKLSQLPYSYPIFIIFAPICREIFMLSFEIMVILDWTFPLSTIITSQWIKKTDLQDSKLTNDGSWCSYFLLTLPWGASWHLPLGARGCHSDPAPRHPRGSTLLSWPRPPTHALAWRRKTNNRDE